MDEWFAEHNIYLDDPKPQSVESVESILPTVSPPKVSYQLTTNQRKRRNKKRNKTKNKKI